MATLTWVNTSGVSDWNTGANWSTGMAPTAADDVVLGGIGPFAVDITAPAAAASVELNDPNAELVIGSFDSNTSTLDLSGALSLKAGAIWLNGGVIVGGTLAFEGGEFSGDGVLSGVVLQGSETLTQGYDILTFLNGLSLQGDGGTGPGTLDLFETSPLQFIGSQTLSGGTIISQGAGTAISQAGSDVPEISGLSETVGTLTLAPSLTFISEGQGDSISGDVLNQGGVTVEAGALLSVGSGGTFDNAGGLTVAAGGTLVLAGGFVNTGSMAIDGAVQVGGSVTVAELEADEAALHTPITVAGTLDLAGGTLDLGAGTEVGTLLMGVGGLIENGTIVDTGGGLVSNGGTLSNIAYQGTLSVAGGTVTVGNGLSFSGIGGGRGEIDVLDFSGTALFQNGQTLDNVNLYLSGYIGEASSQIGTLTLGIDSTLISRSGSGTVDGWLINNGAIAAVQGNGTGLGILGLVTNGLMTIASGGIVAIDALRNTGSISVTNVGALYLGSVNDPYLRFSVNHAISNSGRISEATASLMLNAPITLDLLNSISRSEGIISIGGTLTLGGGTLDVGDGTALTQLRNVGVISGGTIHDSGAGIMFFGPHAGMAGTLNADTYQGMINLIPTGSSLVVENGLTVTGLDGTGAGTVNLLGDGSELDFFGIQTFDNATINAGGIFNATTLGISNITDARAVLTLGPHANISQWRPRAVISIDRGLGDALVNDGVIGAVAPNGAMLIQGRTFTNYGKMIVANGETLSLETDLLGNVSAATLNGGTWQIEAGSTLDLGIDHQIAALNTVLYLGGPGAQVESFDTGTYHETTLDESLQTVGTLGHLLLANGATFNQESVLQDFGRIELAGGTLGAAPLALFPGADVVGYGTISANAIYDSGILMAQGGNLVLDAPLYPGGTAGNVWINVGATLTAGSALAVPVRFVGSSGELVLEHANAPVGVIFGFTGDDVIDLRDVGLAGLGMNFDSGALTISTDGATDAVLWLAGDYVTENFTATSDGQGGILIKDPPLPATLSLADFAGTAGPAAAGGSTGGGGTIAVPAVVGIGSGLTPQQGGALAVLNVGGH